MSDNAKRYSGDDLQRILLEIRGMDPDRDSPCTGCGGSGVKFYGSTATWHGGCGGQMITADVCDRCWGSGNSRRPWPSWRDRTQPAQGVRLEKVREALEILSHKAEHSPSSTVGHYRLAIYEALAELDKWEGMRGLLLESRNILIDAVTTNERDWIEEMYSTNSDVASRINELLGKGSE